jgi:NAD(P)-dependent dehydrogenase (short-subunit alcohol dehydrogenase family)
LDQIPDQSRRVVVITGGNSGIGFETARVLTARGATLVLACRDPQKAEVAADALRRNVPGADVQTIALDLASLASVRACAVALRGRFARIDVLVNNAGVMAIPQRDTAEGIELQIGTNHFGHFALTGLLLDMIGARVVTVSSLLHRRGSLDVADIPRPRHYDPNRQYAASKLANLLFAYELDRRLKAAGRSLISVACHPGYSATNLHRVGPTMSGRPLAVAAARLLGAAFAQSAAAGSLGPLCAATTESAIGGEYFGPTDLFGLRGSPERTTSSVASRDRDAASALWTVSEQLTGVHYTFARATTTCGAEPRLSSRLA